MLASSLRRVGLFGCVLSLAGCNIILGINGDFKKEASGTGGTSTGTTVQSATSTGSSGVTTSSGTASSGSSSSTGTPCVTPAAATSEDITPPWKMMGLDLHGASGTGITLQEAQAINCAGTPLMSSGPDPGTLAVAWGGMQQSQFFYDAVGTTKRLEQIVMTTGYTGKVTWKSPDGTHTYVAQIGSAITKDGQNFTIDWTAPQATLDAEITELYNGMAATFGGGTIPQDLDCRTVTNIPFANADCLISPNDGTGQAYFGMRSLRFYMVFPNVVTMPTTSTPNVFYAFPPHTWSDFTQPGQWTALDPTTVNMGSKGFQGVEAVGPNIVLVPNAPTALATLYDTSQPNNFTMPTSSAWKTFDTTTILGSPKQFSGGASDGQYIYFAPSTNGLIARWDSQQNFQLGMSAYSTFDTTTLTPAAARFASAAFAQNSGQVLFVPAQNGVVAAYSSFGGSFTDSSVWQTYDLTTLNPNLKQFRGATSLGKYIYLGPHGAGPNFPGLAARWNSQLPLNAGWETFDMSLKDPNLAGAFAYNDVVSDGKRYVYYVPGPNNTANGGDIMRYDTQQPFGNPNSWEFFNLGGPYFTTGVYDNRYVYFSGSSSNILRFDTTMGALSNANPNAFGSVDMVQSNINLKATAFFGSVYDGRYVYFIPDAVPGAPIMRLDSHYPGGGGNGRPWLASAY